MMRQYGKEIQPGDTVRDIEIKFLSPDEVLPHIRTGTKFDLWESGLIGEGEVVSTDG
jgi:hypothetical protein